MKGRPVRRQKAEKEAEEKAKREAEAVTEVKRTEEEAKREAEAVMEVKRVEEEAKREAEAVMEVKRVEEEAKKETEATEEAKRAEEKVKKEAEEAEPAVVAKLYKGVVELRIVPPIDLVQLGNLGKALRKVENLRLVWAGGSVDEGNRIVVSAEEPIPLLRILKEMPSVEQVVSKGSEIRVTLKAK